MTHDLIAVYDLGRGSWAELLCGSDGRWRVLVQHDDATIEGVEWLVSSLHGPYRRRADAEDRIAALGVTLTARGAHD